MNAVALVDALFGHGGCVWTLKTDVALVPLTLVSMEQPVSPIHT
jgi:hypothetical protein